MLPRKKLMCRRLCLLSKPRFDLSPQLLPLRHTQVCACLFTPVKNRRTGYNKISKGNDFAMNHQRGNVLFLILIAVALFAVLTYAVTKSNRSGSDNVVTDKNRLAASAVMEYAAGIRGAIMRIKTINGCTDDQISFYNPVHWYNYTNPNAPVSKKCNVFDAAGGNMVYIPPEKLLKIASAISASDIVEHWIGNSDIPQIGTNCATASCADLYMVISMNDATIPGAAKICQAINEKLKLPSYVPVPDMSISIWGWPPFVGTFTNPNSATDSRLNGVDGACFHDTTNHYYTYYQVMIAR
jgi:hypothetical protein